jgi:hypothetical protein
MAQDAFQPGERGVRETQLQTKQYREESTYDSPENTGYQKLLGNGLMIHAENVLRNEAAFMMVLMVVMAMTVRCCAMHYLLLTVQCCFVTHNRFCLYKTDFGEYLISLSLIFLMSCV